MLDAVAVQNYASSGTTLVHSLLDNHPQILHLPGLYGLGFYTKWRVMTRLVAQENRLSVDILDTIVLDWFAALTDPASIDAAMGLRELGPNRDQHPCPPPQEFLRCYRLFYRRFAEEFGLDSNVSLGNLKPHRRARLYAVYFAYEAATGRDVSKKKFICYPAHSSTKEDIMDMLEDFRDVFVLHMVRNPINLFNTMMKYYIKLRVANNPETSLFESGMVAMFLDRALNIGRDNDPLHSIYYYDEKLREKSAAVRLEDIHSDPEIVMRKVCRWIGIDWSDTLLQSTYGGLKWWNRPGIKRLSGFDKAIVSKGIQTYTDALDERRLALIGRPILERYYPETLDTRRSAMERVADWFYLLLPFQTIEVSNFNSLRAQFIAARHLRKVLPSFSMVLEASAQRTFDAGKKGLIRDSHVVVADEGAMQAQSPPEPAHIGLTLVWHHRDVNGNLARLETTADLPACSRSQDTYFLVDATETLRFKRQIKWLFEHRTYNPSVFLLKVVNRYCFLLDYCWNRCLILYAIIFTRKNSARQVPLLYELPISSDCEASKPN